MWEARENTEGEHLGCRSGEPTMAGPCQVASDTGVLGTGPQRGKWLKGLRWPQSLQGVLELACLRGTSLTAAPSKADRRVLHR